MLHEPTIKLSNRTATLPRRTAQTHFGPVTLDAKQQQEFKAWMTSDTLTMGTNILQALAALPNGQQIQQALEQKIQSVVYDRNGYLYHGRVKAVADGAREGGLKF